MIYLDNSATTKPSKKAVEAVLECMEDFGNPSSLHGMGLSAEKKIRFSRDTIASKLGAKSKNIYFTSGGTESDNIAVFGVAKTIYKRGKHIVTTKIEHPAVLECVKELERNGFEVSYLSPDENGVISIDELDSVLREDTILVSIMHVNNETGMIQPVSVVKERMRKKAPRALLHVDAVQGFGKTEIYPEKWGIDLLSVSSHKLHGPQGVGILYSSVPMLRPVIFGGGQQGGIRPGTENVAGIYATAKVIEDMDTVQNSKKLLELRRALKEGICAKIPNVKINGSDDKNAGSVLNVSFIGTKAEILLHSLESHKIYVSTGSACSSHKPQPSHVLTAMGCSKKEIESAVRFSFSIYNTMDEINETIKILEKEVAQIRRFVR